MIWHRRPAKTPREAYPAARPYSALAGGRRRQPIPERITRFYIPLCVIQATDRVMRRFGREERECYVWWGGYFTSEGTGQVVTALCPDIATSYGHIHLATRDLVILQNELRALDQILLIELHTHPPGAGGQNETDAAHPAATYRGFVSIVVPNFSFPRFYDLRETYVYEYLGGDHWHEFDRSEIEARFVIEEAFRTVNI